MMDTAVYRQDKQPSPPIFGLHSFSNISTRLFLSYSVNFNFNHFHLPRHVLSAMYTKAYSNFSIISPVPSKLLSNMVFAHDGIKDFPLFFSSFPPLILILVFFFFTLGQMELYVMKIVLNILYRYYSMILYKYFSMIYVNI